MREELMYLLRTEVRLSIVHIRAILDDRQFFQPYLSEAISAYVQNPTQDERDACTVFHAVFFLTEWGDDRLIEHLLHILSGTEEDIDELFGDALLEHVWLPFARLGNDVLSRLQAFVADEEKFFYSRTTVLNGIIAMPLFHPDRRAEVIAIVERLLEQRWGMPDDYLALLLCTCADLGLGELQPAADRFLETVIPIPPDEIPSATAEDVRAAFVRGMVDSSTGSQAREIFGVYEALGAMARTHDRDSNDGGNEEERDDADVLLPYHRPEPNVGRNDPCPCGSGKKHKKCHGAI